jgi:hypothetical protein
MVKTIYYFDKQLLEKPSSRNVVRIKTKNINDVERIRKFEFLLATGKLL